ncbi:hypothetical protein [Enterococcus faecalis]|uniref:hypothetical protein n=1 Tax=Enterococcus faecalis TaxID=1351 RepID=UPI0013D0BC3B|nr:hypothetical protein [Enterococcus faecalis]NGG35351.1 hypothetical protein [Enterococcus faecalis]
MTKLFRAILTETRDFKPKAKKFIYQEKEGLVKGLDEPWKIFLYELLIKKLTFIMNIK